MVEDVFRPRHEPARSIYDAFQAEAENRRRRTAEEWAHAERSAVLHAATAAAARMGLRAPTMAEVEYAERGALGHIDYGAKWAYGVAEAMRRPMPAPK